MIFPIAKEKAGTRGLPGSARVRENPKKHAPAILILIKDLFLLELAPNKRNKKKKQ